MKNITYLYIFVLASRYPSILCWKDDLLTIRLYSNKQICLSVAVKPVGRECAWSPLVSLVCVSVIRSAPFCPDCRNFIKNLSFRSFALPHEGQAYQNKHKQRLSGGCNKLTRAVHGLCSPHHRGLKLEPGRCSQLSCVFIPSWDQVPAWTWVTVLLPETGIMPAPLGLATIATLTLLHPVICEFCGSFHFFRPVISFFLSFSQQYFEIFNLVLSIHIVAPSHLKLQF